MRSFDSLEKTKWFIIQNGVSLWLDCKCGRGKPSADRSPSVFSCIVACDGKATSESCWSGGRRKSSYGVPVGASTARVGGGGADALYTRAGRGPGTRTSQGGRAAPPRPAVAWRSSVRVRYPTCSLQYILAAGLNFSGLTVNANNNRHAVERTVIAGE